MGNLEKMYCRHARPNYSDGYTIPPYSNVPGSGATRVRADHQQRAKDILCMLRLEKSTLFAWTANRMRRKHWRFVRVRTKRKIASRTEFSASY